MDSPAIAPFAENIRVERPVFSTDGEKLYFESYANFDNIDDMDIFMVERQGDAWTDPVPVSPLINSPAIERLQCVTSDGSIYFTRNLMRNDEAIYVARLVNGKFTALEELNESYNAD